MADHLLFFLRPLSFEKNPGRHLLEHKYTCRSFSFSVVIELLPVIQTRLFSHSNTGHHFCTETPSLTLIPFLHLQMHSKSNTKLEYCTIK